MLDACPSRKPDMCSFDALLNSWSKSFPDQTCFHTSHSLPLQFKARHYAGMVWQVRLCADQHSGRLANTANVIRLKSSKGFKILMKLIDTTWVLATLYNTKMKVVKTFQRIWFQVQGGLKYPYESPCKRNLHFKVIAPKTLCLTISPPYI